MGETSHSAVPLIYLLWRSGVFASETRNLETNFDSKDMIMENPNSSAEISPASAEKERTGSRVADVAASAVLGGATAGVIAGSLAGPIGAAVGALVGAVAAGLAGNAIDESIDREIEESHWREAYSERPYVRVGETFDDFGPAYGYGVTAFILHPGQTFEDVENALSKDWASARGASALNWDRARPATKDAWYRVGELQRRRSEDGPGRQIRG